MSHLARQQQRSGAIPRGLRRIYTPFNPDELAKIDAWGFDRRIRDRSEAIRSLVLERLANKNRETSPRR
jgi:hypothetical protein